MAAKEWLRFSLFFHPPDQPHRRQYPQHARHGEKREQRAGAGVGQLRFGKYHCRQRIADDESNKHKSAK